MQRGDVYLVQFPPGNGREQAGTRPAIVVQDPVVGGALPTILVIPLTSQLAATRFPATLVIEPDPRNGLTTTSVALVFQTRAIDRRRLGPRLGAVKTEQLETLLDLLAQLVGRR